MSYPNVCPDCNGHFDPGHTCPPTSQGNRIRDLERQLAEAQARLRKANCDYGDGWINDDLECQRDVEPWCGKHAVLHYIAENARLQEDKRRQQRYIAELIDKRFDADNERKRAEALAERRKKELVKQGRIDYTEGEPRWHIVKCRRRGSMHPLGWADCSEDCQEARAAIEGKV